MVGGLARFDQLPGQGTPFAIVYAQPPAGSAGRPEVQDIWQLTCFLFRHLYGPRYRNRKPNAESVHGSAGLRVGLGALFQLYLRHDKPANERTGEDLPGEDSSDDCGWPCQIYW